MSSGFKVVLFVQQKDVDFDLCKVAVAPKVYRKNLVLQYGSTFKCLLQLIFRPAALLKFMKLERKTGRSTQQILKNIYNNSHILKADLDWLHFGFATMALQSENVAEAIGAKMAVSFRGFDLDVYSLKFPGCYELLWKRVTKVHSISNYLLQEALSLGLSSYIPAQVVTPAIDISKFKGEDVSYGESLNILTVGRLHWIKGISYVLEALSILKRNGVRFSFTIIGEGPGNESVAFEIHQLGLTDEVKIVGKIPHDKTLDYYSKSNMYVQYSNSEGFCNAVLEAQAMGLLCVVSDGGALPENVLHMKTGWVVPKRNPELLAKAIIEVHNLDPEKKTEFVKNAQQRVLSEFNLKNSK